MELSYIEASLFIGLFFLRFINIFHKHISIPIQLRMDIFEVVMLIRNKRPRKFPPGGVVGDGGGSCEGKTLRS